MIMDINDTFRNKELAFAEEIVFDSFNHAHLEQLNEANLNKVKYYFQVLPMHLKMKTLYMMNSYNIDAGFFQIFCPLLDLSQLAPKQFELLNANEKQVNGYLFKTLINLAHESTLDAFRSLFNVFNEHYTFENYLEQNVFKFYSLTQQEAPQIFSFWFKYGFIQKKELIYSLLNEVFKANFSSVDETGTSFALIDFFTILTNDEASISYFERISNITHQNPLLSSGYKMVEKHYKKIQKLLNSLPSSYLAEYLKEGKLLGQIKNYYLTQLHMPDYDNTFYQMKGKISHYIAQYSINSATIFKEVIKPLLQAKLDLVLYSSKESGNMRHHVYGFEHLIKHMNALFDLTLPIEEKNAHGMKNQEEISYMQNYIEKLQLDFNLDGSTKMNHKIKL